METEGWMDCFTSDFVLVTYLKGVFLEDGRRHREEVFAVSFIQNDARRVSIYRKQGNDAPKNIKFT